MRSLNRISLRSLKTLKKICLHAIFFFILYSVQFNPTYSALLTRALYSVRNFFRIKSERVYSMFSGNKHSIHIDVNTWRRVESYILFILYSHKIILSAATVEFSSSSHYIIITLNNNNTYRLQCNTTIQ